MRNAAIGHFLEARRNGESLGRWRLADGLNSIGSGDACNICLKDPQLAGTHLQLTFSLDDGEHSIEDVGGKGDVYRVADDGSKMALKPRRVYELKPRHRIVVGDIEFRYLNQKAPEVRTLESTLVLDATPMAEPTLVLGTYQEGTLVLEDDDSMIEPTMRLDDSDREDDKNEEVGENEDKLEEKPKTPPKHIAEATLLDEEPMERADNKPGSGRKVNFSSTLIDDPPPRPPQNRNFEATLLDEQPVEARVPVNRPAATLVATMIDEEVPHGGNGQATLIDEDNAPKGGTPQRKAPRAFDATMLDEENVDSKKMEGTQLDDDVEVERPPINNIRRTETHDSVRDSGYSEQRPASSLFSLMSASSKEGGGKATKKPSGLADFFDDEEDEKPMALLVPPKIVKEDSNSNSLFEKRIASRRNVLPMVQALPRSPREASGAIVGAEVKQLDSSQSNKKEEMEVEVEVEEKKRGRKKEEQQEKGRRILPFNSRMENLDEDSSSEQPAARKRGRPKADVADSLERIANNRTKRTKTNREEEEEVKVEKKVKRKGRLSKVEEEENGEDTPILEIEEEGPKGKYNLRSRTRHSKDDEDTSNAENDRKRANRGKKGVKQRQVVKEVVFRVACSGFTVCDRQKERLRALGLEILDLTEQQDEDEIAEFDILVVHEASRDIKLLIAIIRDCEIVTSAWLDESDAANGIQPCAPFHLIDEQFEMRYDFKLSNSLKLARTKGGFLEGQTFWVSPEVKPSQKEVNTLINSADGVLVTKRPTVNGRAIALLGGEHDSDIEFFRKNGVDIYSAELVLNGCLKQRLELERYKL